MGKSPENAAHVDVELGEGHTCDRANKPELTSKLSGWDNFSFETWAASGLRRGSRFWSRACVPKPEPKYLSIS